MAKKLKWKYFKKDVTHCTLNVDDEYHIRKMYGGGYELRIEVATETIYLYFKKLSTAKRVAQLIHEG